MSDSLTDDALVRAFVQGAQWWQYHANGSTAFASERDEMEAEAEKRLKNGTLGESQEAFMKRHFRQEETENI